MKYSVILSIAAAALPLVLGGEVTPRDCAPTKCSCHAIPDGLFCGDGLLDCTPGHVYQCGGDGKKSCDFGPRDSCQKCGELEC